jgi:CMP-2-keto-3-deoxyoctulosonic acid synthetase
MARHIRITLQGDMPKLSATLIRCKRRTRHVREAKFKLQTLLSEIHNRSVLRGSV